MIHGLADLRIHCNLDLLFVAFYHSNRSLKALLDEAGRRCWRKGV